MFTRRFYKTGERKRAASGGVLAVTCGSLEESFSTDLDSLGKALRKLLGDAPLELRSHYLRKIVRPLSIIGYALRYSKLCRIVTTIVVDGTNSE
jgi:hypothetical protein